MIRCPVAAAAAAYPEATAVDGSSERISYRRLDRLVAAAAAVLYERGCRAGDHVGTWLPTTLEHVAVLFAAMRLGGVICPVSLRLPKSAAAEALERGGCSMAVVKDQLGSGAFCCLEPSEVLAGEGMLRPERLLPSRRASLIFTSGSTGKPKAVVHSFRSHHYSAVGANANMPLGPGDRWLLSLPLYHVGGLAILFRCALAGAAMVLPEGPSEDVLDAQRVTHVSMVPTQLLRLLGRADRPPHSLRALLLGGGPASPTLIEEAIERGVPLHRTYGLTEMASQVTTTPPDAHPAVMRTSGRLLEHRKLRISEEGQILVGGGTLFQGYWEEGSLKCPVDAEGWYPTGDAGRVDEQGCLVVEGRLDNMFISGGENIHPEEIERALLGIEGIVEAVVVPVDDLEYGSRPFAFVRSTAGDVPLSALGDRLQTRLPRFKIPVAYHPLGDEPLSLKPDRMALRSRAAELAGN